MIKRCKCCGQKFEVTKGGITICSDCKAAEGKYDEIYRAKIREQKKLKNIRKEKVKEIEPDRSKCATCSEKKQLLCLMKTL